MSSSYIVKVHLSPYNFERERLEIFFKKKNPENSEELVVHTNTSLQYYSTIKSPKSTQGCVKGKWLLTEESVHKSSTWMLYCQCECLYNCATGYKKTESSLYRFSLWLSCNLCIQLAKKKRSSLF